MEQLEQTEDVDGLAFQHGPTLDLLGDALSNDAKVWLAGFNLVATVPARDWLLVSRGNKLEIYKASKFLTRTVNDSNFNFETCILDRISYPGDILNLVANYNKAACCCKDERDDKKYLVILDFESRMQVELKLDNALVDLKFLGGSSGGFGSNNLDQSQKAVAPNGTFSTTKEGDLLNISLGADASKNAYGTDCLLMTDANSCLYKHDGKKLVRFKVSSLRISEPLNGRLVLAKVHDSKVYIGVTSINKECKLGATNYHELVLQEPDVATDILGVCALPNDHIALVVALQDDGDTLLAIAKATSNELVVEYMGFNELFIDVDSMEFVTRVNCNLMWDEAWRCLFCWSNCASNVAIVSCNESLTRAPEGIWRSLCMREGFFLECTRPDVFPRGLGICTSFKETLYRKGACADTPPLTRPPVVFLAQSDGSISISYVDVWIIKESAQVQVLPFEAYQVCDDDDLDDDEFEDLQQAPSIKSQPKAHVHVSSNHLPIKFDPLKIIDGWHKQLLQRFKAIEKPNLQELERLVFSETLANALVMLEKSMVVCDAINGKTAQSLEAHANDIHVLNVPKVPDGAQEYQQELLKQLNALQLDLSLTCNGNLNFENNSPDQSQKPTAPTGTFSTTKGGDLLNPSLYGVENGSKFELLSRAQSYASNICSALGDEKSLSLLARGCRSWMQEAEVNLDATGQLLSSLKKRLGTLEQRLDKLENRRCVKAVEHLYELKTSDAALETQEPRGRSKSTIEELDALLDEFQNNFKCRQAYKFQPGTLTRPLESSGSHYNEAAALVCKYDFTRTSSSRAAADLSVGDTTTLEPPPSSFPEVQQASTVEAIKVDTVRDVSSAPTPGASLFSSATKVEAPPFGFGASSNDGTLPADLGGFQVQQYTFGQSSGLLSGPATVPAGASATPSVGTSVFSSFASKPSSLLDIATGAVGTPTAKGFAHGDGANTSLNFGKGLFGNMAASMSSSSGSSTQNISSGTFTGVSGFTSGKFAPSTCLGSTSSPQGDFWNRARSSNPLD